MNQQELDKQEARDSLSKYDRTDAFSVRHMEKSYLAGLQAERARWMAKADEGFEAFWEADYIDDERFGKEHQLRAYQAARAPLIARIEALEWELREAFTMMQAYCPDFANNPNEMELARELSQRSKE